MRFKDLLAQTQEASQDKDTSQCTELRQKALELVEEVTKTSIAEQLLIKFKDKAQTFSKFTADQLLDHRAEDHHITLEEEQSEDKLGHTPLY